MVDTGFNGFLTLPVDLVNELELPFASLGRATLADGSVVTYSVHEATVLWDGQPRHIEVDAAETTPLIGMLLLHGHGLSVQVRSGGRVVIRAEV